MKYPKDKYILNINDLIKLKEIYIYGTGVSSRKLKDLIDRNNMDIKILGFIDSYKESNIIGDIKIYNINDFISQFKNSKIVENIKDDFLEYCKTNPTYNEAVTKYNEKVFEYELLRKIIIKKIKKPYF